MANQISFSVIIPTMGRQELSRTLASALGQTLAPVEIFVVDNGPIGSDATTRICSEFNDERIRTLSLPPYSGDCFPRNVGAWNASSPYLAFLDDDDVWAADYLERVAQHIDRTEADLVFGTRIFLGADDTPVRVSRAGEVPPDEWLGVLLRGRNPGVGGQNIVVRRDRFFALGGFPIDLPSGGDRGFTIKALRAGVELAVADDAVVYMRDPTGVRVTGRSSNWWANDLKILLQNWHVMSWRTRLRHGRSVYERRRNDNRQRQTSDR